MAKCEFADRQRKWDFAKWGRAFRSGILRSSGSQIAKWWKSNKSSLRDFHNHLIDTRGNFIFRSKSRRLCAPPFCEDDFSDMVSSAACDQICAPVDVRMASSVCATKIPVLKTIRLCDLLAFKEMALKNNLDPRIIFLTRDPRGILQSKIDILTSA